MTKVCNDKYNYKIGRSAGQGAALRIAKTNISARPPITGDLFYCVRQGELTSRKDIDTKRTEKIILLQSSQQRLNR